MVTHAEENNGCLGFMALKDHRKGVSMHAVNLVQDDKILNNLFYSGEKKPHTWWDEFYRQLTNAFNTYDRLEKRIVYSNDTILFISNRKILVDFLQATRSSINY